MAWGKCYIHRLQEEAELPVHHASCGVPQATSLSSGQAKGSPALLLLLPPTCMSQALCQEQELWP